MDEFEIESQSIISQLMSVITDSVFLLYIDKLCSQYYTSNSYNVSSLSVPKLGTALFFGKKCFSHFGCTDGLYGVLYSTSITKLHFKMILTTLTFKYNLDCLKKKKNCH